MIYLFSESGLRAFDEICAKNTLFAFDYDGTLTGIFSDPGAAQTPKEIEEYIYRLSEQAPTAVISGRGLRDLKERFDVERIHLIGNHGIEGLKFQPTSEFKNAVTGWVDQLTQYFVADDRDDVLIENKLFSLSIHYRMAKDPSRARESILKAVEHLDPKPRIIYGDHVVNIVPQAAPHKGDALLAVMKETKARKVVFIGDDLTDEDAFGLDEPNLFSIKVRSEGTEPVPTRARYFLKSQSEMLPLLQKMVQTLKA